MIRVLYVDDEQHLLSLGKVFLERSGDITVDCVLSVREALGLLKNRTYDAILSDYQMPGTDGIEFLKYIRPRCGTIPFILFTGRGREEVVIEAINSGADFYLQKGGDPKAQFTELITKIRFAVQRRNAIREAKEAGDRYKALISVSNTGAWEYHQRTGYLWCSPEYFSMLGRDLASFDISGKENLSGTWLDLMHPDDRDRALQHFQEYLKSGSGGLYESHFRLLHSDGRWVWILSRGRTLLDEKGQPTDKTVGTHIDITERKEAEEALAGSERRYRSLFEGASDALFLMEDDRFIDCNVKALQIYGCTREQIIGSTPYDLSPPEQPDGSESKSRVRERLEAARTGTPQFFEWTQRRPDGTEFLVEVSLNRIDTGQSTLVQAIIRDITERKQAEAEAVRKHEELNAAYQQIAATDEILHRNLNDLIISRQQYRESEERYRSLVENIPDVSWTMTRDLRYTFISPNIRRVLGFIPDEICEAGDSLFFGRVHPDERDSVFFAYHALFEKNVLDIEFRIRREDGAWIWLQSRAIGTYEKNAFLYADGILSDITAWKESKKAIQESESLFRAIFENTGTATIIIRNDTTIEYANSVFESLSGYSRKEIEGTRSWTEFVVSEDLVWMKRLHDLRRTSQAVPLTYEFRYIDKFGNVRNCINHVRLIPGTTRSVASIIDVTDRKQVEAALKKSEALYRTIFEDMQDLFYRTDLEGNILMVSPAGARLARYSSPDDLVGKMNIRDIYANPDDREALLAELAKNGQVNNYPLTLKAGDGALLTVTASSHYYRDDDGKVLGVEGMIHDITSLKKAEADVVLSNERLRLQTKNLSILNRIITVANRAETKEGLLDTVLGETLALLDFDAGGVYLIDPCGTSATVVTSRNLPPDFLSEVSTVTLDTEPYSSLFFRSVPIITDHYEQVSPEKARRYGFCSVASVPLSSKDRVEGCLNVISTRRVVVSGEEKEVLISIGRELGTILGRFAAEEDARQTALSLGTLLDSIGEMIFILDHDGRVCKVNESVRRRLQYTDDELVGKNVLTLHLASRAEEARSVLQEMLDGTVDVCDVPLVARDGSCIEVETRVTRGRLHEREVLIGVSRDVGESRRAKEQIERIRGSLADALSLAKMAVWELDAGSHVFTLNDAWFAMHGTDAEREGGFLLAEQEVLKRFLVRPGHGVWKEAVGRLARSTDPDESCSLDGLARRHDGTLFPVTTWFHTVRDGSGAVTRIQGVTQDITEREAVRTALKESETKYQALFSAESDGIFVIDVENERIVECNDAISTMYGYERSGIIGKDISVVIGADTDRGTLMSGTSGTAAIQYHRKKDGTRFPVEVSMDLTAIGDHPVIVATVRDITEREHANEALRHANRQLNLLSSITRHDILNKVSVIRGYLELAREKASDPALGECIGVIESATKDIKSQIEFTRVYQDLGTHAPQWQALDSILPRARLPDGMRFFSGVGSVCVYADPMLGRVFENLLDNSVRHGEHVTEVRVSAQDTGTSLVITWEDNGTGIPPEEKEQIFALGVGKNTGLGLFLVREVLSLTGITIRERGVSGAGARFEISVPAGAYREVSQEGPPY